MNKSFVTILLLCICSAFAESKEKLIDRPIDVIRYPYGDSMAMKKIHSSYVKACDNLAKPSAKEIIDRVQCLRKADSILSNNDSSKMFLLIDSSSSKLYANNTLPQTSIDSIIFAVDSINGSASQIILKQPSISAGQKMIIISGVIAFSVLAIALSTINSLNWGN